MHQGTLDLMVLKTLDVMGPRHGYGIARRIEQVSDDLLHLNEGTVYAGGARRTTGAPASTPSLRRAAGGLPPRRKTGSASPGS